MHTTGARKQTSGAAIAEDLYRLFIHMVSSTPKLMADLELNVPQIKTMHALAAAGDELAVGEFAERLGISLPAASRAVDALVQRGLAERREDERDRRMKRVRITDAGREAVRRIHEERTAVLEQLACGLDRAERQRLAAALQPLVAGTATTTPFYSPRPAGANDD